MIGRIFLFLLILISPVLGGETFDDHILASRRSENPMIILLLQDMSFTDSIGVFRSLGEREDRDVDTILQNHLNRRPFTDEDEYLLHCYLQAVASREAPEETVQRNPEGFDLMSRRVVEWRSPQLRRLLVSLYPYYPEERRLGLCLIWGKRLIRRLGNDTITKSGLLCDLQGYLAAVRLFQRNPLVEDQLQRLSDAAQKRNARSVMEALYAFSRIEQN